MRTYKALPAGVLATVAIGAAVAAAALAGAALALADGGGEAIALKPSCKVGERWTVENEYQSASEMTIKMNGQVVRSAKEESRRFGKADTEFLEVAPDGTQPTAVKVAYDPENGETKTSSLLPAPVTTKRAFAGQTVTARRGESGEVTHDFKGKLAPDEEKQLRSVLRPRHLYFPKTPVKVGDKWTVDPKDAAAQLDLEAGQEGTMSCELKSLKDVDGRKAAEIALTIAIKGKKDGLDVTMDMTGTTLVDLATGRDLDSDMSGPVTVSGSKEQTGRDGTKMLMEVSGAGKLRIRGKARPVTG